MSHTQSKAIYEDLCTVLPGGVNSPVRACSEMGQFPLVAEHAAKDQIFDVDGNGYIDYCGSWGALIHGHAHPEILSAVQKRMMMGTSFGVTTPIEGQLAHKIIECVPSIEKIRFVSSGTEATMSAVRLARGFTGRQYVIKFNGNYHGHADLFLVQAGSGVLGLAESSSAGIPVENVKYTISLPYNDCDACRNVLNDESLRDQIAAVIVEPIAGNIGVVPGTSQFLQMLREETKKIGALLIFDEVISGFRVGVGGAQALYQITPDLTCFGKIMGGGFPAAAFGGRRDIMDRLAPLGPVYQAGTLSGNPVAMEAGVQSLILLQKEGFYQELERKTNVITVPLRKALEHKDACVQQVGSMFTLFFGCRQVKSREDLQYVNSELYARCFRFLFSRGVYIPPSAHETWFVSNAHEEGHLEKTRDLLLEFVVRSL
jgi:glutamate-1-semialdehyde 2,1-aminomutase